MKAPLLALAIVSGAFLAGCPSDEEGNPAVLWLALDGSELQVKLVDEEPIPF
ncbi:MAG: hypothetical protein JWP01_3510 [Myxococcales bacterium]|nr:hypothetical protein [Myxococcales bacterium]